MEHRRQKRRRAHFSFRYRHDGNGTDEAVVREGKVVDFSERGIRFEAVERIPVGTRLQLIFEEQNPLRDKTAKDDLGVVVWSIQPDPGKSLFRVGLKFI